MGSVLAQAGSGQIWPVSNASSIQNWLIVGSGWVLAVLGCVRVQVINDNDNGNGLLMVVLLLIYNDNDNELVVVIVSVGASYQWQ